MSASLPHLARRFFGVLRSAPLRPEEQAAAARLLATGERALFWEQGRADQRHGWECARAVLARCPERNDLAQAALLHDIGKRHAGLGATGRTVATAARFARLPLRGRYAAYLDHAALGAADLEAAGAEPLVVAFARHHHAARPAEVGAADWDELSRADRS